MQHAVETIWLTVRDLLEPTQPVEVRHTCLGFIKALIYGQVPSFAATSYLVSFHIDRARAFQCHRFCGQSWVHFVLILTSALSSLSLSLSLLQFEDLGILRSHFFRLIQQHTLEEDVQQMYVD